MTSKFHWSCAETKDPVATSHLTIQEPFNYLGIKERNQNRLVAQSNGFPLPCLSHQLKNRRSKPKYFKGHNPLVGKLFGRNESNNTSCSRFLSIPLPRLPDTSFAKRQQKEGGGRGGECFLVTEDDKCKGNRMVSQILNLIQSWVCDAQNTSRGKQEHRMQWRRVGVVGEGTVKREKARHW